jgi:hypothetical protein
MRRSLALAAAAASLLRAAPARGEPYDMSLPKLGVPSANVICALKAVTCNYATDPQPYLDAAAARQRFAMLATQLALALDSFILAPANTVGHSGFEFGFEAAYAPVSFDKTLFAGYTPFRAPPPSSFLLPSFHVRKALPYSFEVGGRGIYLNQSTDFATQLELKWALNEGLDSIPDVAVRAVVTRFFGVRDLDLGVYGVDAMVGKRFGLGGVLSLTPYGAARFSWVWARSGQIQFGNATDPNTAGGTAASFPELSAAGHRFTRFALGLRLISAAVTLSVEGTYTLGRTFDGAAPADLGATGYPTFKVPAALSAAAAFGFTF